MPGFDDEAIQAELEKEAGASLEGETPKGTPAEVKPGEVSRKEETPADEPELDLGKDKDGNPRKVKLSQITEWEKGHLLQKDYTKKTQELAQQRKELQELVEFGEYLKKNPEKLKKVLAVLEDKVEEAKTNAVELAAANPNDPQAKLLQPLLEKLNALEQKIQGYEQNSRTSQEQEYVKQAQKLLNETIDESAKAFTFDGEEDKGLWRRMILSHLKDNPGEYHTEDEFRAAIQEVGKQYYDLLNKVGEGKIKKYLDSKKAPAPPAPTGTQGSVLSKKPNTDNLEDLIVEALEKESTA
jgi:hypothetical protein